MSVGYCSDEFLWLQENTNTSSKSQRDVSLLKKNFSFKERAERDNIDATDLDVLIANFLLQVREVLFLICVKKPISMKILVLRVINIVYGIEIALYGVIFTRCLCQKPSLARTSLVRVLTQTTREYNPVRRTFYAVNYMYDPSPGYGTQILSEHFEKPFLPLHFSVGASEKRFLPV